MGLATPTPLHVELYDHADCKDGPAEVSLFKASPHGPYSKVADLTLRVRYCVRHPEALNE